MGFLMKTPNHKSGAKEDCKFRCLKIIQKCNSLGGAYSVVALIQNSNENIIKKLNDRNAFVIFNLNLQKYVVDFLKSEQLSTY